VSREEEEALKLHGWYSHFVLPENGGQNWVNYHTHGLPELYGHFDFQLVLPIEPAKLHKLAARLVERVKKGERFTAGMRVSGILDDYGSAACQNGRNAKYRPACSASYFA